MWNAELDGHTEITWDDTDERNGCRNVSTCFLEYHMCFLLSLVDTYFSCSRAYTNARVHIHFFERCIYVYADFYVSDVKRCPTTSNNNIKDDKNNFKMTETISKMTETILKMTETILKITKQYKT